MIRFLISEVTDQTKSEKCDRIKQKQLLTHYDCYIHTADIVCTQTSKHKIIYVFIEKFENIGIVYNMFIIQCTSRSLQ